MTKKFSVWLRVEDLEYENISQAISHCKSQSRQMNDGMSTRFNGKIKVLEALTHDFHPLLEEFRK